MRKPNQRCQMLSLCRKAAVSLSLLLGCAEIQEGNSWVALLPTWLRIVPKKLAHKPEWERAMVQSSFLQRCWGREEVKCCIYKVLLGKVHYGCSEKDAWFLELFVFLVEEPRQSKAEFKLFYRIYSLAITCSAFNSPCVQLVSSLTKNALF